MISDEIKKILASACKRAGFGITASTLKKPDISAHGDYSSNIALAVAGIEKTNPRLIAERIVECISKNGILSKVEVASAGYINFYLSDEAIYEELGRAEGLSDKWGAGKSLHGNRMMFEYTDPNPFKAFHVGHLMSNAIGEALARLAEWQGAHVIRANYQGDVGLHVGKAIYGMLSAKSGIPAETAALLDKIGWLQECYVFGAQSYENDPSVKHKIDVLNKTVFDKTDPEVNKMYSLGREWSLANFEEIYRVLGTKFDYYFFESEVAEKGITLVDEYKEKGVFVDSEGAVIFDGEPYGLHKRVFITSNGLPTYEAKDLGLNVTKFEKEPELQKSVIVTGAEQDEYFKVLFKAFEFIDKRISDNTVHVGHGLMLGADKKKVSSRRGGAASGEELLLDLKVSALKKILAGKKELSENEAEDTAEKIATGAIKYVVLKQNIGKNIVFDEDLALSFEGDSGPYLQYTCARINSILSAAEAVGLEASIERTKEPPTELERYLIHFENALLLASIKLSPNYVTTYIVELARLFNSYYASHHIVDAHKPESAYRLYLAKIVLLTLKNGLKALGIPTVERM
ncbi:MAG: arginine--tRNA ligase [Candidatus Vogelbacteria bacterium]|nr:arginine--tRNA ligase [Candidatus Vogelbacteria bacterium]